MLHNQPFQKRLPVDQRNARFLDIQSMFSCAVALVDFETIDRILLCHLDHVSVTSDFGGDGGKGYHPFFLITLDYSFLIFVFWRGVERAVEKDKTLIEPREKLF